MNITSSDPKHGFQFPTTLEISAMGAADAELHVKVPAVIEACGLSVVAGSLRQRPSSRGNYVSVTVMVFAASREAYDAAHEAVRAVPEVKWTL